MQTLQSVGMYGWDRAAFLWLNLDAQSPSVLIALAVGASRWLPTLAGLGLLVALLLGPARWRHALLTMATAMAMAWLGASLIKQGVTAPRPFMLGLGTDWLGHSGGNGFPSSHASVASAFAVSALLSPWPRAVRGCLALAGALICWSRIAVGVHFPSDVIAAMLLGGLCALLAHAAAGWLLARSARARQRGLARHGQTS